MQKKKAIILAVIMVALVATGALGAFLIFNKQEAAPTGNKANVSWYTEDGKEFVISTVEELYGLVKLSDYYDFTGQTIKLGADIVVNEGNAEDWAEKAPSKRWYPVDGFAGTFDGQGHTISGLYGSTVDTAMGLFSNTKMNAVVKDFRLLNSYFKVDGLSPIGSVVSNGCGTIDKIYSDAIIFSNGENAGGIIGNANNDGTTSATSKTTKITNCWFDGEVHLTTTTGRYGGGIAGRVYGGTMTIAHCLNSGVISAETKQTNGLYVGGIFGALTYTNFSGAVTVEDSLNVGEIEVQFGTAVGSIAGGTLASSTLIYKDTYATEESYKEVCNYQKSSTTGGVPMISTEFIQGEDWYKWTTLDYDQYWTVTEDSTPILKAFADEVIDMSGLTKGYSFDWYNEYAMDSIIDSVEDLYGFALMSYSQTFQGKIVKLGADIVVNKGKVADWASGKEVPDNTWIPIGRTPAFQGTFDGQGYTISGLYGKSESPFMGLFGWVGNNGEVKNVRVTDSCFISTTTSSCAVGSIAGRLEGKIDTVYSDAAIVTVGSLNGGIAGYKLTDIESSIKNCWYAGTIYMNGDLSKYTGGIIGRQINGDLEISHCLFTGKFVIGGATRSANTGGFVGANAYRLTIKDCLNAGTFEVTEADRINSLCRGIGQISNSAVTTVVLEDSYFTNVGENGTWNWYCAGALPTVKGTGIEMKAESDILGYDGYRTTALDFDNYWTVVVNKDGTPILKSFANKVPSVAGLEKNFDKSWYDYDKTTYVLTDVKDLYGFMYLSNSKIDFKGKTITLGKDIVVNGGSATDWAAGKAIPANMWKPVGKNTHFEGTFDGQGHAISGLYGVEDTPFMGLFAWIGTEGSVRNLRLINSYLESTSTSSDGAAMGSIVGRLEGNIHTVYSDAILKSPTALNGGIVGYKLTANTKSSITNTWYAGTIYMVGNDSKHTGGIVGRVIGGELELNSCLFTGTISIGGATRSANTGGLAGNINGKLIIRSSLSDGMFELTEAKSMNSLCRVIGQISDVASANVLMENTYFTNKGANGSWNWYTSGSKATIRGSSEQKMEEDILGYDGFRTTSLDFDNYWTVVLNADGTPILKSFADKVESVAGQKKIFDKSWYDEDKTTYVLEDKEDLYGFLYLSNSKINFKGKTVTLGKDIVVNQGLATAWKDGTSTPELEWAPIGKITAFAGVFDGNGKTISGLYGISDTSFMGFFGWVDSTGVIKDFRLKNTFFESTCTASDGAALGSIAGRMDGVMDTVYSDAILRSCGALNGGLAGYKNFASASVISNCWYAGEMYLTARYNGGIIGRVIKGSLGIDNCLFSGKIYLDELSGNIRTGGFAGQTPANIKLSITNCLNSGAFIKLVDNTMTGLGRIMGENSGELYTENVYATNIGDGGTSLWYSPGTRTGVTPQIVAESDISGEVGYYVTALDFDKYWTIVLDDETTPDNEEGTPVLRSFADVLQPNPTIPDYADISWYDGLGNYKLSDRADLYGLAYLVKTGISFVGETVTLTENIAINTEGTAAEWAAGSTPEYSWEPIGGGRVEFAGTFDGNGKTVSGIYVNVNTQGAGFFKGTAEGSTIKNLRIENTYINSTYSGNWSFVGSVVGVGGGDILNVYSDAIVNSAKSVVGGLAGAMHATGNMKIENVWFAGTASAQGTVGGIVGAVTRGMVSMNNCLNTGTVTGTANSVGGLCGRTFKSSDKFDLNGAAVSRHGLFIENSLNVGTVSSVTWAGSVIGYLQHVTAATGGVDTKNVYATNESFGGVSKVIGAGDTLCSNLPTSVPEKDITGELAYYNTNLFRQNEKWALVVEAVNGKDGTPVLKDFIDPSEVPPLPTLSAPDTVDISWYNGVDNTIGNYEDNEANVKELLGLAWLVENGYTLAGSTITLQKDIEINANTPVTLAEWTAYLNADNTLETWTPIGTADYEFAGTFDGNNHSIKGVYVNTSAQGVGFFRSTAEGSTIQNLRLENSYINSTCSSTYAFVGSVVGSCGGNLINVYSNAVVKVNTNLAGGLVGEIWGKGTIEIEKCWFAGSVNGKGLIGGIAGAITQGIVTIDNCLNTGTVNGTGNGVGGLCGRVFRSSAKFALDGNSAATTHKIFIKNSLNVGNVAPVSNAGSIIGWIQHISVANMSSSNVYATNESCIVNGVAKSVGNGATYSNIAPTLVPKADITVSADRSAADVLATLKGWGFDTTIWTVGAETGSMPQLNLPSPTATVSGFGTKIVMAIKKCVAF